MRSWVRRRLRSFGYAFRGLAVGWAGPNFRIQLVAAATVLFLAGVYSLTRAEFGLLLVAITIVLSAELANTAVRQPALRAFCLTALASLDESRSAPPRSGSRCWCGPDTGGRHLPECVSDERGFTCGAGRSGRFW